MGVVLSTPLQRVGPSRLWSRGCGFHGLNTDLAEQQPGMSLAEIGFAVMHLGTQMSHMPISRIGAGSLAFQSGGGENPHVAGAIQHIDQHLATGPAQHDVGSSFSDLKAADEQFV